MTELAILTVGAIILILWLLALIAATLMFIEAFTK